MGMAAGTTTNAIIMIAYGLGNAVGPFMWKKKYQPRCVALPAILFLRHPNPHSPPSSLYRDILSFLFPTRKDRPSL